jgi:cell wall assembly regulator SMI1
VASPEGLTNSLLDELAVRWRAVDAPIASALEPGLSPEAAQELLAAVGLELPAEANTLWAWHNGAARQPVIGSMGHYFGSLQYAIAELETMRRIAYEVAGAYPDADQDELAREVWNWNWLPLFSDAVGGMLVIDAGPGARAGLTSPVGYRDKDDGDSARPVASSIGALIRGWVDVLDSGAVQRDPVRGMVVDFDRLPLHVDRAALGTP